MSSYLAFALSCRSFWSERTKAAPVAKKHHKYSKLAYEASFETRRKDPKNFLGVRQGQKKFFWLATGQKKIF